MNIIEVTKTTKKADLLDCLTVSSAYDAGFYEGVNFILSLYEHQDSTEQFERESEEIRALAETMYFNQ